MPKSHIPKTRAPEPKDAGDLLGDLVAQFAQSIRVEWKLPPDLCDAALQFLSAGGKHLIPEANRTKTLAPIIARKFRLNGNVTQALWNEAARLGFVFDPAAKARVVEMFNTCDQKRFALWLDAEKLPPALLDWFHPASADEALDALHQQLKDARINRSDARKDIQEERRQAILRSLFGTWLYECVDPRMARSFFTNLALAYVPDTYFQLLRRDYSSVLDRRCGGMVARVPANWWAGYSAPSIREKLCKLTTEAYQRLSNHSYFSVLIDFPDRGEHEGPIWELIGDLTLYAERHRSARLKKGFFRPAEIESQTRRHIQALPSGVGDFEALHYGFAFKDCIVSCSKPLKQDGDESRVEYVFLLFEKHEADETAIPCPACWSRNVRGNSYPFFGVKSWECQNPLCPERSAFDRGNRFSAMSILRNEAANDGQALIDEECLREWKLDVVASKTPEDFIEMFVRHYSLPGDVIHCVNWPCITDSIWGRRLEASSIIPEKHSADLAWVAFERGTFFDRYLHIPSTWDDAPLHQIEGTPEWLTLFQGSCLSVLRKLPEGGIDGAVTSPPYYNAREYSAWSNLYAYLYDMKVAAEGVHRVLRPGGYYLFNIFDYFDNDNILAFSALGKRRLPLGAYLSQIFRLSGFEISGNIIWHKGEIEGKRNYNQGNRAPFFQLPLNTWEHILILRKPGNELPKIEFPRVIYRRPVFKWVNGENRHGHSAPFPESIPDMLCLKLPARSTILDPFGGSLTTALAAKRRNQKAVAIELHESYCRLGLQRILDGEETMPLFEFAEIEPSLAHA